MVCGAQREMVSEVDLTTTSSRCFSDALKLRERESGGGDWLERERRGGTRAHHTFWRVRGEGAHGGPRGTENEGEPDASTCCTSGPPSTRVQNCENIRSPDCEVSVCSVRPEPLKTTRK